MFVNFFPLLAPQAEVFVLVDVLEHFGPVVGSLYFQIGILICVLTSNDALMSLKHGLLAVPFLQVQCRPSVIEVIESYPNNFVFVLEGPVGQGLEIVLITS